MSGIGDLLAQSNDRWASARRRAQGIADKGLGETLKTYYTLFLPVGLLVLMSLGTLGGMLIFRAAPSEWPSYLVVGCLLAVLGVAVGGLVYNAKRVRPAAEVGRIDVLLSLENHERKHVRRQILGKAPIEPAHLPVSRGAAVQMRKGLATQLLLAPVLPFAFIPQAVNFMMRGNTVVGSLMGIGVVVLFIGQGLLFRDFRRAGTFLARTAEQTAR